MRIINPIEVMRQNKQQRIDDRIAQDAQIIGSELVEQVYDADTPEPYVFPVRELPRGVQTEDYLRRVGSAVVNTFRSYGLDKTIIYNDEATRLAYSRSHDNGHDRTANGTIQNRLEIIFSRDIH